MRAPPILVLAPLLFAQACASRREVARQEPVRPAGAGDVLHHAAEPRGELPSAAFRAHHAELREHLGHLDRALVEMPSKPEAEQLESMRFVARFLREHVAAHAADEERALYPAVDRHAGGGERPFTATMRYEHRLVERWIGELETLSGAVARPDVAGFVRRGQRLLGLLEAHFGAEEEVLLPVLDARLSPGEFRAIVGG